MTTTNQAGTPAPAGQAPQVATPPPVVDPSVPPPPPGRGGTTAPAPTTAGGPTARGRAGQPEPQLKLPAVPTLLAIGLILIVLTAAAVGLLGPVIGVTWTLAAIAAALVAAFLTWCYIKFGRRSSRTGRPGSGSAGSRGGGLFGGGRGGGPLGRLFGGRSPGGASGGGGRGGALGRLLGGKGGSKTAGGPGSGPGGGPGGGKAGKGGVLGRLFGGKGRSKTAAGGGKTAGGGKAGGSPGGKTAGAGSGPGGGKTASAGRFGGLFGRSRGSNGPAGTSKNGGGPSGKTSGGKAGDPLGLGGKTGGMLDRVKKIGAQQVGGNGGDLPTRPATGRGGAAYTPGQGGRGTQSGGGAPAPRPAPRPAAAGGGQQQTTGGTSAGRVPAQGTTGGGMTSREMASIQGFAAKSHQAAGTSNRIADMVGRLAAQGEENQPVPRVITDSLREAEKLLRASGQELNEAHAIYRRAHGDDDDRDRAPRKGSDRVEQNADVGRNVRDNG